MRRAYAVRPRISRSHPTFLPRTPIHLPIYLVYIHNAYDNLNTHYTATKVYTRRIARMTLQFVLFCVRNRVQGLAIIVIASMQVALHFRK